MGRWSGIINTIINTAALFLGGTLALSILLLAARLFLVGFRLGLEDRAKRT